MNKKIISLFLLGCITPAFADDFDLNSLIPATSEAAKIESVSLKNTKEIDGVILADSAQSGTLSAHQILIDSNEDGVKMIMVGSGIGILSLGSSSYNNYENRTATLLSKRAAYTMALQIAKKQLVENLNGMENSCEAISAQNVMTIDTDSESLANASLSLNETCSESVKGALSGYTTFDVFDDINENEVRVSLISTPKTREQTKLKVGALTQTTNPNEIFKQIIADLRKGVTPPVGAKILTHPETNESYVIGFGSAIIRKNKNKNIARKLKSAAKQQSQAKARNALLATMKGDDIYWSGGFSDSHQDKNEQFKFTSDSIEPANAEKLTNEKGLFSNTFKLTDAYTTVAKGKLPQGVSLRSFSSNDGDWMLSVAVYAPSLQATAIKAAKQNDKRESGELPNKIIINNNPKDTNNTYQGPSGQVNHVQEL